MQKTVDKQTFLAGVACRTRGWYMHHAEPEVPSPGLRWRFYAGADVGNRAREWLGEGRMLPSAPQSEALDATQLALADPSSTLLFEASFTWSMLAARADALSHGGAGWHLIEVKSGTSPADGKPVKSEYIDDIAYTMCIAGAAGVSVTRASIVLINRAYRLGGAGPMLVSLDVTDAATARAMEFQTIAEDVGSAAVSLSRPVPELSFACKSCEFFSTDCVSVGIPDPLFTLPRLSEKRFDELRSYERVSLLPPTAKLTETQQGVADVIRTGTPRLDATGLSLFDHIVWPVYYLDFEAVSPHLPWFDACPPYDATPFQYSLHIRSSLDATETHCCYLASSSGDWRRELVTRLLKDLGSDGSIMVYSSYEKTRLNALAALFPDLAEPIAAAVTRLFDLEEVVKRGYIHPGFAGRTSIKKVLPVLVPALSYENLMVGNGDDAAAVFALMRTGKTPEHEHRELREALLAYCSLDTLAMLRLHEALWRLRGSEG